MAASSSSPSPSLRLMIPIFMVIVSLLAPTVVSVAPEECGEESGSCIDKSKALPLKIISIVSLLVTSVIGVSFPLFSRAFPALQPDRDLFVVLKAFAAGIILATGFMHVLPDSFEMLSSACLPENPWHKFPFTGFVAMLSAIVTLMIESLATSVYDKKNNPGVIPIADQREAAAADGEMGFSHSDGHNHLQGSKLEVKTSRLLRYRVVAMVLELGIIVHSVVIGLSLGATDNVCTIKGLVAALCFHQMFEGMGLGGCILQAEYDWMKKLIMVLFFSFTTPLGVMLGIGLSKTYRDNSPSALITVGILNASSAGLLIYMALVDLLASDFMGAKLQGRIKLQIKSYAAVLLGAGGMSLMAKWA